MANINRDYLIVLDAKSSVISEADELKYYITDQHSQNLFVNLVVRDIERINKYVEVHDPEKYQLELHIIKPNNDIVRPPLQANLLSVEDAIYAFELPKEAVDYIGTYKCELRVTYQESEEKTITTSNKFKYRVKRSIYNDLDGIVEAPKYPIVIQLLDKLSDINQYEEDRRANELARQLAEEQRQTRFNTLDADMTDSIQAIDDKVVDVENRISTKEQVVDKLIVDAKADINNYKVAKDQEIDDYKTAKDTEINNAIAAQDNKINTAITTQNDTITQAIANQDTKIDTAITAQNDKIEAVQNNDAVQNNKLDTLQNKATIHEERITATEVKNTEQDNRLDIIENTNIQQNIRLDAIVDKNIEQDSRLDTIEAIDVAQNSRLDAIEVKSQQQDDRLLDIEKVNKRQDMNLKCLFAESKNNMIDITEEGNSIYLQNSTTGYTLIDEIKGNTLVNCNKEPNKELILNGNINTSGDNTITITEGVDGGLVDVALEGNTLVNVSKTKDSTALPLDEELTYLYANTQYTLQFIATETITADITLGGTQLLAQSIVAGLNRISITTPSELVDNKLTINGNDTGANIMEVIVTDADRELEYFEGMKSVGEGKELQVISINSERRLVNTQRLTHEPLRGIKDAKDRYALIDGKWYIERKCGIRAYQEGDEDNYKTDLINTVYPLEIPTYEEINYNPLEVYSGTTHITTNSVIPTNITVKNHGFNCLLKPNTTYTVSSNIGLNTVTTPSVLTEDCLRFMDTDTSDVTTMRDVLVLEGDWTTKADLIPANFSGIESAFEQEYDAEKGKYRVTAKVVGKNLFDGETRKGYYSNGNFKVSNSNLANVNPIRVRPNTSYVGSGDRIPRMTFYDKDMNFLLYAVNQCNISPSNAHYMNIHCNGATWFQIEQGNTATTYEPYKENNITFYINEPLRGVGDVKDRVYVKDDKVIVQRNCGIRPYEDGDFGTYPTDKINTVYPLAEPAYEEVEYNDTKLFIESFKNSTLSYNSNVPVSSTVHYSYSVPIIDTVAQTANVTDQQDSMIIDLATQVAVMEMMLM